MDYAKKFLKGSIEHLWASVEVPYNQPPAGNTDEKTTLLEEENVVEFDQNYSWKSWSDGVFWSQGHDRFPVYLNGY